MAVLRKFNSKAKTEINTGFGTNASDYGGRFVNKTVKPNIEIRGVSFLNRIIWYHTMLSLPGWKFFTIIFAFYIIINSISLCMILLCKNELKDYLIAGDFMFPCIYGALMIISAYLFWTSG